MLFVGSFVGFQFVAVLYLQELRGWSALETGLALLVAGIDAVVSGTKAHADDLRDEVAAVLAPMGLRLSVEKTKVAHIDEGLDSLGWRIQRHQQRGGTKRYVYTYPAKKALASIVEQVRTITRQGTNLSLDVLLLRLNRALRGWTTYFRPGVSSKAFQHLRAFTWRRVIGWLRRKHPQANWKQLRRRYCPDG